MTEFKIGDRIKLVKPYADYTYTNIHAVCEVINLSPFFHDNDGYIAVKIISSTTHPQQISRTWDVISSLFKLVTPVKINWKERLCK